MPYRALTFLLLSTLICRSEALADAETSKNETTAQAQLPPSLHPGDVSLGYIHERDLKNAVPESLIQMGADSGYFSKYAFVVDKSVRSLGVWMQEGDQWKRVGHYPTDIGKKMGDKHILGDHRTPEGVYFFIDRYEGKNLDFNLYGSLAFATDYPNLFDRRDGKTGSGIWLHAVPDTIPLTRGSRGCVVIRNDLIKEAAQYVSVGKTPIIIKDTERYLTIEQWQSRRKELLDWLEGWRATWESRDMAGYMKYYSEPAFNAQEMNWAAWRDYKSKINQVARFIEVKIAQPVIYSHKNEVIIKFLQNYKSNLVSDIGQKTLYLKKHESEWKIISEEWRRVSSKNWHTSSHLATAGTLNP